MKKHQNNTKDLRQYSSVKKNSKMAYSYSYYCIKDIFKLESITHQICHLHGRDREHNSQTEKELARFMWLTTKYKWTSERPIISTKQKSILKATTLCDIKALQPSLSINSLSVLSHYSEKKYSWVFVSSITFLSLFFLSIFI